MKKYITIGLMSMACGEAIDETKVTNVQWHVDGYESESETEPFLIGRINVKNHQIDFIGMPTEGEETSIIVSRRGPIDEGDIVERMQAQISESITPAEIWLGLADQQAPSILIIDHLTRLQEGNRTSEFLIREPMIDIVKNNTNELKNIGQLNQPILDFNVLYPAIPNRSWCVIRTTFMCQGNGVPRMSCSEYKVHNTSPDIWLVSTNNVTQVNNCPSNRDETGWIRHSIYNDSFTNHPAGTAQPCGGNGSNWSCFPAQSFPSGFYWVRDWDSTFAKRMAFGVDTSPSPDGQNCSTRMVYSVAKSIVKDGIHCLP